MPSSRPSQDQTDRMSDEVVRAWLRASLSAQHGQGLGHAIPEELLRLVALVPQPH